MSDQLITRAGTCLHDRDMKKYDHKAKKHVVVPWADKDYSFSRLRSALNQKAGSWKARADYIIPEHTPISDQGAIGSCVANAWCDMMEILDGLEGSDKVEQLSRLFLYWTARYYTGDTDKDAGTFLRSAGHQLNKIGIIEERHYPYEDVSRRVFKSPELDLYTMASNNRLTGFYRPDGSNPSVLLRDLELSIRANHPFVFGTPVTDTFQRYRGNRTIWGPPRDGVDTVVGGHAMICTGVGFDGNQRWWLWRNSWGKGWGDGGHCKVNDNYILACRDIWVGTKMHNLV